MPASKKLTEDQKIRRRAARKADAMNQRLRDDAGPLYEHEIPAEEFTNADEQYWASRQRWAFGKGEAFAELWAFDQQTNLFIVRNIAKKHMKPDDFAICDSQRWTGPIMDFWKDVLTGRRKMTVGWNVTSLGWKPCFRNDYIVCCEHGCKHCEAKLICYVEKSDMKPALEWPAPDYKPPLTPEEYDALLKIPDPMDEEAGIALAQRVDEIMTRCLGINLCQPAQ